MNQISILTAFAAGVVSFLSPCVLPLVPGYISFISGLSLDELTHAVDKKLILKKAVLGSLFFVAGFSLVFTSLGASATFIGKILLDHMAILSKIAGAIIILFGLHTAGILPIKWLYYQKRIEFKNKNVSHLSSFLMGLAFGFGWTPCIGPILAGILALASTQETVSKGVLLLFIYSMGLGIPFILTAFATNLFLQFFNRYKKWFRWGEIASGLLLVFIGILIFSNKLSVLIQYLPEKLTNFSL